MKSASYAETAPPNPEWLPPWLPMNFVLLMVAP